MPEGLQLAGESEIILRFGSSTCKRKVLSVSLLHWIQLCRSVGAKRLFVDGSFVTSKPEPGDIDAVVWLSIDFADRVCQGQIAALELDMMLTTRQPEEIFAAEDRLADLQREHPVGEKGFTKAGIRKLIASLNEELAIFEGSEEARAASSDRVASVP